MEYKKTYTFFKLWFVVFCVILLGISFVPTDDVSFIIRLLNNICTISLTIMIFIIELI